MRFLLDENVDARLVSYLLDLGHDVATVSVDHPASLTDQEVLRVANEERRILLTNDRGFGELVVVRNLPHFGVVLFRLDPAAPLATKIERLAHVLSDHGQELDRFLVVTSDRVRVQG